MAGRSWEIPDVNLNEYQISPENYSSIGIDLYNWGIDDGTNIWLYSYWGGKCQKWTFADMGDSTYQIRCAYINKPILVIGSRVSGADITQMTYDADETNQLFSLKLLELSDSSSSIAELDNNSIHVYPDTTKDILNISINNEQLNKSKVAVYNNLGQMVFNKNVNSGYLTINSSGFKNGIYFLHVSNKKFVAYKKFIKH